MPFRRHRPALRLLTAVVLLSASTAAVAKCPPVRAPLHCIEYENSLAGPPIPAGQVEVVYLHLPSCKHCVETDPGVNAVLEREPGLLVRKHIAMWTTPKDFAITEPRIADALLEFHGRPWRDHDALAETMRRNLWTRERAEAFFTQRGLTIAQLDKDAQSFGLRALVQRRIDFERAARATQVPFAVVNRRYALSYDPAGGSFDPAQFSVALANLIASTRGGPAAAVPGGGQATSAPAGGTSPTAPAARYAPRPMPMPADFLPSPKDAASLPPRRCPATGSIRTSPRDLTLTDEMARRMQSQLRSWGAKNFRFDGPAGCTDWDFVVSQWQAMKGLPQTGVLDATVVASVLDEAKKMQPRLLAAQEVWSKERAAAIAAGIDPQTGQPMTAEERERRRRGELARATQAVAATPPGAFVRPAPVGPPEKQVFGFSLGADFAPQLPICPARNSWSGDLDFKHTCQYRLPRLGVSSSNWLTPFEAQLFSEYVQNAAEAVPELDGLVAISFATDERPGIIARAGIRGVLVDGRLEGIGFVPGDKDSVLEALQSRYGAPTRVPVSMQNESGAQWTGWRYEFRRNDVTATMNCVGFGTASCSFVEVLTPAGRAAFAEWRRREAKKGTAF